jgi:hypothetical protein
VDRTHTGLRVLAVGMLDVETFGSDTFFVQTGEDEVALYRAHRDGRVEAEMPRPAPLAQVTASIEKFNNMFRLDEPIAIGDLSDLVALLGRFAPTSATTCRRVR